MPSTSDRVADAMNERWVSVEEVATHVGVRKESIYRWIEARALPAMKIGKLWKLKLSEVDAWVRAGGTEGNGERRLETPGTPSDGTASTAHTSTVLIVDDDENTRETLRDVVSEQGYTALTAIDGLDALNILRADGHQRPALILLDLAMPNLDGLGFLDEQRRDPRIASIPVIIITAGRQDDGTYGPVLRKPLEIGKLVDAIQGAIRT
jgi:excisionase family DNA binding protein